MDQVKKQERMEPVKASRMRVLAHRFVNMNFRHRAFLVRTLCGYSPLLLQGLGLYDPLHLQKETERGAGLLIEVSDGISTTGDPLRCDRFFPAAELVFEDTCTCSGCVVVRDCDG